jgi:phospholipid transport system substrate-binding protein
MAGFRRGRLLLYLVSGLLAVVGIGGGQPEAAVEVAQAGASAPVARLSDAIIDLMRSASQTGARNRLDKFLPVLRDSYDLETALRIVAAPYFDKANPADRQALIDAFARRSAAQYVDRFDSYNGERIEMTGERAGPRSTTLVDTRLVRSGKEPVQLTYVVRQREGRWGIIDVLAQGDISQLAVQRSDYAGTLRSGGVPALIRQLDAGADSILASQTSR